MKQPEPFLKQVARHFLTSGQYVPEETCIVFPNKRAIVYFSKYISELTEKPVWAPGYSTINDLMEELSGLVYADRIFLIFEIYRLYLKITGSEESFDRFYPMTETLLGDFDETDKYLVNNRDLFSNLASIREMGDNFSYMSDEQIKAIQKFWNTFDPNRIPEGQKAFLSFWEVLPVLYEELKKSLLAGGLAYEGLAYRKVAEMIKDGISPELTPFKKYLFTGFNALNRCEEILFRYLQSAEKAEFFYDYDDYYLMNPHHEAGYFIKNNLRNFPPTVDFYHNHLVGKKKVSFLPMSSDTGQATSIPFILDEMGVANENSSSTAIILADENMLIPVLYSLPGSFDDINVTMGYPASGTAVFSLVNSLGKMAAGLKNMQDGSIVFIFNDVLSVLKNPLLKNFIPDSEDFVNLTRKSQPAFINKEQIPEFEYRELIFSNMEMLDNPCRYLFRIIDILIKSLQPSGEKPSVGLVNMAVLIRAAELTAALEAKLNSSGIKAGTDVIFRLIRKILGSERIPFEGEPLAGIQVMGMLETRTLDFDNIIMMSMNEGIMPGAPYNISFIPYNLRKGFDLPTSANYDAISAYYFYRVIQRAKNIFLLYNNSATGLSTGERSRFLHQLYYEYPGTVNERSFIMTAAQARTKEIRVEKTAGVVEIMNAFYIDEKRVLTPSAINEYINCPLKFYFHYIAGLPKPAEKTESLDVRVFGNILHNSMSLLYANSCNKLMTSEMLAGIAKDEKLISHAIKTSFIDNVFIKNKKDEEIVLSGLNLLIYNIIKKYIIQLIKYDIACAPLKIVSLEKLYAVDFKVSNGFSPEHIRLGGVIDRLDSISNIMRILDYKTGKPRNSFPGIESLFDTGQNDRNDAVLQVLIYSLVYERLNPGTAIEPGLLFIQRSRSAGFNHLLKCGGKYINNYEQINEEFEVCLSRTINSIFDPALPFTQTENKKTCSYCHFAGVCHR